MKPKRIRKLILIGVMLVVFGFFFWFGLHIFIPLPESYYGEVESTQISPITPESDIDFSQETEAPINPQNERTSKIEQTAWIPDWDFSNGMESFKKNSQYFGSVSPVWYYLNKDGTVRSNKVGLIEIRSYTKARGIKLIPSIASFSADEVHKILNNPKRLDNHAKFLLSEVSKYDYDGLDLDYESFYLEDQPELLQLLKRLYSSLDRQGKKLTFPVYPVFTDSKNLYSFRLTAETQNWGEIGQYVHELRIMSYSLTGPNSKYPGPVSPVDWHSAILRYATTKVPTEKIVLGMGLYGYDGWSRNPNIPEPYLSYLSNPWQKNVQADAVTFTQIINNRSKYRVKEYLDEVSGEKVLEYKYKGKNYIVFFTDASSIISNAQVANKYNIKGIAYWRLGNEDQRIYKIVNSL